MKDNLAEDSNESYAPMGKVLARRMLVFGVTDLECLLFGVWLGEMNT